jgi:hypothetical protein
VKAKPADRWPRTRSVTSSLPRLFWWRLPKTHARAPAVLVEKFDPGPFKGASDHVEGCATRLTETCLQLMHRHDVHSGVGGEILLAPFKNGPSLDGGS